MHLIFEFLLYYNDNQITRYMLRRRIVHLNGKQRESVKAENRSSHQIEWTSEHISRTFFLLKDVAKYVPSRYEVKEVKNVWQSGWYHGFTHHSSLFEGEWCVFYI
jgi:hypothetical protein